MADYSKKKYETIVDIKDDKKIKLIKSLIPENVSSIIDIGCGNGIITNELSKEYDTLGVDINESKLKHVSGEKLLNSCDNIEKPERSFDLVFSSELLEHLDYNKFKSTVKEFARLGDKFILISVPYEEPLHKLFIQCRNCKTIYNKNGHLKRFNKENIKSLFNDFALIRFQLYGRKIRGYNNFLASVKRILTPMDSWISSTWKKEQGVDSSYCTTCGYKNMVKYKFNIIAFFIDAVNILFSQKKPGQIIALYKRESD